MTAKPYTGPLLCNDCNWPADQCHCGTGSLDSAGARDHLQRLREQQTGRADPAAYPVTLRIPLPPYGFAAFELQPELQEGWIARRVWVQPNPEKVQEPEP
jgi:hypothetical protein